VPPIVHQQLNPSPEITSSEIQIPDDQDWGTGTFTVVLKPTWLPHTNVIAAAIINAPRFQLTATFNPNGELPVLLGSAEAPRSRVTFVVPPVKQRRPHVLRIEFAAWQVFAAFLDDVPLKTAAPPVTH